jgi:ABC-type sugar transport system permease subunit
MRAALNRLIQTRLTKFFVGGLFLVVSIIVLYPVLMLLYGSVRSSAPGDAGFFTLQNYFDAYGDRQTYRLFLNTFLSSAP